MVHFLRTQGNRTIIECEVYNEDLHSVVGITEYSTVLLLLYIRNSSDEEAFGFSDAISSLSEIRGWWWEQEKEFGDWKSIDEFVAAKFKEVAKEWNLFYTTD